MASSKQHFKIAVIGRSGAGKTTFINCLANHMHGVRFHEKRHIVITQVADLGPDKDGFPVETELRCTYPKFMKKQYETGGKQSLSQTTKPSVYRLENDRFKLTVIDTPGIGDTGGMEIDKDHCKQISAAVGALSDINAVVLVHKANDCRTDIMLKYLYRQLQSVLPKKCKNNLLIAFTAVQNPTKIDALSALEEMGIPTKGNYFAFENTSLIPESEWLRLEGGKPQQISKKLARLIRDIKNSWQESAEQFSRLFEMIRSLVPLSAQEFMEISIKKNAIAKLVSTHYHTTVDLEIVIGELDSKIEECKRVRKRIQDYADHTASLKITVRKERKVTVTNFWMTPIYPNKLLFCYVCRGECHSPCQLENKLYQGSLDLSFCVAFGGDETTTKGTETCTVCHHGLYRHSHSYLTRSTATREVTEAYYVEEPYVETDFTKEQLNKLDNELIKQLDKDCLALQKKKQKKENQLDYAYRSIAYLQFKLESIAFSSDNEFLLEFLEYRRNEVIKDPSLTDSQRAKRLEAIKRSAEEYKFIKESVRRDDQTLTQDQEEEIDDMLNDEEDQQWALVGDYQLDMADD